jgi:hypothetical protein
METREGATAARKIPSPQILTPQPNRRKPQLQYVSLRRKAAGCRVLGVLGKHSAADMRQADWIVGSLEGLAVTNALNPSRSELRTRR